MTVTIKSAEEIEKMRVAGRLAGRLADCHLWRRWWQRRR